ncbi:PTS cellobiose transporter subunit IIC [Scopulibacillus cellulosilyticus]|uniref:Permease IIC component n=1 Tax=Scopulibacillus cellulosilyticus TaxID=2665665 RepID=A0ABW2PYH6_9BACL
MNAMMGFLEKYMLPIAGKIQGQKHLQSIRDGIILAMPLIIVGSVFLIIANLPIPGFSHFMASIFGDTWSKKFSYPIDATFSIMSIIVCFGIGYRLAERYKVDALSSGAIALSAFILSTPQVLMFTPEGAKKALEVPGVIPVALMGSQGLFVAMIVALFSTEVYRKIIQKNIVVKMPQGVPPAVSKSFTALVPAFVVLTVVWIVRLILEATSMQDLHHLIDKIITTPLSFLGGSLWGMLIAVLAIQLLWCFGLHGDAIIVDSLMSPIWLALMDQNRQVYMANHHADLPNIICSPFLSIWIEAGGSGLTFGLVLLMIFRARSKQMKQLGKIAVAPSFFNINEPTIFGTPIVMNPVMMIPFILTPIVIVLITYFSMAIGLVAKPSGVLIPWTTPLGISGFLATGKISGGVIQIINLIISILIYYPFLRLYDKQKFQEEHKAQQADTPIDRSVNV